MKLDNFYYKTPYRKKGLYGSGLIYDDEEFKEIEENVFPGIQQGRYFISNYGNVYDKKDNKVLYRFMREGYHYSSVYDFNNNQRDLRIERIMMMIFHPIELMDKKLVLFKNDNYKRNNVMIKFDELGNIDENNTTLKWVNKQRETEENIRQICQWLKEGKSSTEIARRFGKSEIKDPREFKRFTSLIMNIKHKRSYKEISKFYF